MGGVPLCTETCTAIKLQRPPRSSSPLQDIMNFWQQFFARVQLPCECLPQPRCLFQGLRRGARKSARVTQFIEKLAASGLKALNVLREHLAAPIPKARSDGEPCFFGVEARPVPRASLVEAEHGFIVRHA